jgi:hypothetical protein
MGLDRLPRIRVDHEFGRVQRHDIDWLIAEVMELRELLDSLDRDVLAGLERDLPRLRQTLSRPSPFERDGR